MLRPAYLGSPHNSSAKEREQYLASLRARGNHMFMEERACSRIPSLECRAARRQFLTAWCCAIGLGPFVAVVVVLFAFLPDADGPVALGSFLLSLAWGIGTFGYTLFLAWTIPCPACDSRIGSSNKCSDAELRLSQALCNSQSGLPCMTSLSECSQDG